ncbi:MAG: tRNA (adenosine(37)-N6)-threonylcarbamoyltransferase complex dimerization subunit type 1 TsaB [Leptospira sp.]|nr:tRNA (adenosine(37)-N6)-threonylcarbamoyltransferase complex dimerization subunit type 1 TsaB [Leptospira sp.]
MKVLFFDATQDWLHVAINELSNQDRDKNVLDKVLFEKSEYCPKESSFRLVSEIQKALKIIEIKKPDAVVCLLGPGSFTGIRITVATARNLSQLWKIASYGIDSVEAYAVSYFSESRARIHLAIDGKQNKFYYGSFDGTNYSGSRDLENPDIKKIINLDQQINKQEFVFVGQKPECFPEISLKIGETLPKSMPILRYLKEKIIKLDYDQFDYLHLIPNYIRGSYVETNKK